MPTDGRPTDHYTVGGTLEIEDPEVLSEEIEDVTCRWCGTGEHVVALGESETPASGA
ncbi:MAG: hypothetical protein U5R31_13860 [Acidimicrobiia bacterium]|nr:hypothetical protein [Acidimicrobiia bacterium]